MTEKGNEGSDFDDEIFNCPFCEEEHEHEKVEKDGNMRWKCKNCGVIHN